MRTSDSELSPIADPSWQLIEEGIDPAREREIESLLAIGNGYLGVRASIAEDSGFSRPATFIAGIFVPNGDLGPRLAVVPHLLHFEVTVEKERLSLDAGRVLLHRRRLDLRQGILWREWRQQDPSGRITRLTCLQLASLANRHTLLQSITITAENYAGRIEIAGPLPRSKTAPADIEAVAADSGALLMHTSGKEISVATRADVQNFSGTVLARHEVEADGPGERWSWEASLGETRRLDRVFSIFNSRDVANPSTAARDHLASSGAFDFRKAVAAHLEAWRGRWEASDVRIVGDDEAQRALRFAIYHLIAAVNPFDERVSVGARGLTGEAYRGHVFWDTEIFMLPFYILTDPQAARAVLMYRHGTLDAARRKAKAQGYDGALYAWESADTGDEVTPKQVITPDGHLVVIHTGEREHHISADIAYGVWQYWRATGDDTFVVVAGAEILVETARFWASRAKLENDGHAHIRQVIGPDEYHELVDDNAYTNAMAALNLEHAADTVAFLSRHHPRDSQELFSRLALTDKEPQNWRALAGTLATGFDPATNLFEQFAGYFRLEDVKAIRGQAGTAPIDVSLGAGQVSRSKIIKQADVVALSALLWEKWPTAVHKANFRYYEPRTAHGSSLSPAFHALVAARLGDRTLAQAYFRQAAEIDLANNMGNAAGGVHMGALGALWQAAVFGAAGLCLREDGIAVDPHLLPGWAELAFPMQWRGRLLHVRLQADPKRVEVRVDQGDELTVAVLAGPACHVRGGQCFVLQGDESGWADWQEVTQ